MLDPAPQRDVTCPNCGALIYSHRARMCGQCGIVFPPEMVLTDEQARAQEEERAWARELANRFDAKRRNQPRASQPSIAAAKIDDFAAEQLIQHLSYQSEFNERERPAYLLITAGSVILMLAYTISRPLGGLSASVWIILVGFLLVYFRLAWVNLSPFCPNCDQNVRTCRVKHCYVCGEFLTGDRCGKCQVNFLLSGNFETEGPPVSANIMHCPNCAVLLNSSVRRPSEDGWGVADLFSFLDAWLRKRSPGRNSKNKALPAPKRFPELEVLERNPPRDRLPSTPVREPPIDRAG